MPHRTTGDEALKEAFALDDAAHAPSSRQEQAALGALPLEGEGFFRRIVLRRWLLALAAGLLIGLGALHSLPWQSCAAAFAVFTIGAGLIPLSAAQARPRTILLRQPVADNPAPIIAALVGALPEPALVLARDGSVLFFNGKALEFFPGMKQNAHISAAVRNPKVLGAVEKCGPQLARQVVFFTERVPVERHLSVTVNYLEFRRAGSPPAIFLIVRDLTEQMRHDQLRADFIANASHEIKTPLTSLIGYLETLQGAARHDDAARERFLAIMAKQAERMSRLIDNLMSLSRVEMRAHLKPQDPVPICELVEQACDALDPLATEAGIDVSIEGALDDAHVLGDKDELTQVFINLIHNGIKYGRPGGYVKVRIERKRTPEGPKIAIAIEDNGPGIAPQHLPRLTERFYRVPEVGAYEKGGTGLGLAIVKHVLNRHRGELEITSKVGVGSTFTVILAELIES